MPYLIEQDGGEYVVKKKDGGKVIGHTKTKDEAEKLVEAIYANENGRSLPDSAVERRYIQVAELRLMNEEEEEEDDLQEKNSFPRIAGMIPFNSLSESLPGNFRERIMPTAFSNSLASNADIRALFNHDDDKPLGSRNNRTLSLRQTDRGLRATIRPPATSWGKDAVESVRAGLAPGLSFGFHVRKDSWTSEDGQRVRSLEDVDLREVSIVFNPAYRANAEIALRDLTIVAPEVRSLLEQWQPDLEFYEMLHRQRIAESYR